MKKSLLALGCALCVLSLSAETFDEVFKDGISKIRGGQSAAALECFQKASELASNKAQKTNAMLQISLAMPVSRADEALQMLLDYRKTAGTLPKASEAWLELRIGVLQANLKKSKDAEQTLSYALSLNKLGARDKNLAFDKLSLAQSRTANYDGALESLNNWENLDGITPNDYARLLTRRAGMLCAKKQLSAAYEAGLAATDVPGINKVNRALAWQMLAFIAISGENNPQKALEFSEKSRAANQGKSGFNKELHQRILNACKVEK